MKYFIATIMSTLFLLGVAACGDDENTAAPTNTAADVISADDTSSSDSEETPDGGDVDTADTASAVEVSVEDSDSSE